MMLLGGCLKLPGTRPLLSLASTVTFSWHLPLNVPKLEIQLCKLARVHRVLVMLSVQE